MICSGTDALTGQVIEVSFSRTISNVHEVPASAADPVYLAPGFIDIQVNGFMGVDFNDPVVPLADLTRALHAILQTGVTRCLPTVITGGPDDMLGCLRNLRRAQLEIENGHAIAGFHVEGPYIGPEDGPRGAHPARWVRPPSINEYRRWQDVTAGQVRVVTISPHWAEAPAWISAVAADGVTVSIGHTGANSDQIQAAVDAGATLSTHLGNGAHQQMRRHPNYIWDQMAEDRLSASLIADGIHLGRAFLQTALRAKTPARSILVTDASAPAGAIPGRYRLGEQDADLTEDGRVVLAGTDKLAGSALKMNDGVAKMMSLGGLTLAEAIATATLNPARLINLDGHKNGIAEGDAGDLVAFRLNNGEVDMEAVYLAGQRVR
ncbi:MAG: N-acetylglucosamine-6-phosphate deacetylase [Acidobacteriia bacterium]|nr:N-acetylglucosamine-6-phosphate deacetylase [Terriglobia bacterium]